MQDSPQLEGSPVLSGQAGLTGLAPVSLEAAQEQWAKADAYYYMSIARMQRLWEVQFSHCETAPCLWHVKAVIKLSLAITSAGLGHHSTPSKVIPATSAVCFKCIHHGCSCISCSYRYWLLASIESIICLGAFTMHG